MESEGHLGFNNFIPPSKKFTIHFEKIVIYYDIFLLSSMKWKRERE